MGVKRPESAPGVSTTIQSIGVDYIIGEALLDTTLKYQVHSTSGGYQTITIPAESEVEIVLIDDKKATIASENGKLKIPLGIGKQRVQIDYRDKYKQGIVASMPVVGVGVNGADVNYNLNIPENRWLIWAYGPNWGPAIMFWPKLFLILILSILAARFIPVKIGFINWLLLGFGFATLPIGYVAIVPIWLVVLNYKGMLFKNSRMLYNLGQIVIITLTIGVLVCAYLTVLQGLIVRPDMEIRGIGSSSNNLHWYADKTDQFLPAVGIISLPLFIYRIVMFLWSAWFAYTLVSWLRNAWDKFSTPTLWQSSELGVPDK